MQDEAPSCIYFPSFFSPPFFNPLANHSQILQSGGSLKDTCVTTDELLPMSTEKICPGHSLATQSQPWEELCWKHVLSDITELELHILRKPPP